MDVRLFKASQFLFNRVMEGGIKPQPALHERNPEAEKLFGEHTKGVKGWYARRVCEEWIACAVRSQVGMLAEQTPTTTTNLGVGVVPALLAEVIPMIIHDLLLPKIANVHFVDRTTGKIRKDGAVLGSTKSLTTAGADARALTTVDYNYSAHAENAADIGRIKPNNVFVNYDCESRMLSYDYSLEAGIAGPKEMGINTLQDGIAKAFDRLGLEYDAKALVAVLTSNHAGNVNWNATPSGTYANDPEALIAHDKRFLKALEDAAILVINGSGYRPNVLLCGSEVLRILAAQSKRVYTILDDKVLGMIQGDTDVAFPVGNLATKYGYWTVFYVPFMASNRAILQAVSTKRGMRTSGLDYFIFQGPMSTEAVLNTTNGTRSAIGMMMVDVKVGEPKMFATVTIISS